MAQIVLAEVAQRALYGLARALAEAAQRRFRNGLGELLQKVKVLKASFVCDDAVQNLQHALCTLTAGNAFAAGFVLSEVHEEARDFYHACGIVHYDETAGAYHCACFFQ